MGRDRVALARAGDLEDALAIEIDAALLGPSTGSIHPSPHGLGQGEGARRIDDRLPDAIELLAVEEGEMSYYEIYYFSQYGMALLEAEQPVDDYIIRKLKLPSYFGRSVGDEESRIGIGPDGQEAIHIIVLERKQFGRIVLQQFTQGNRQSAIDIAIDPALSQKNAITPYISFRGWYLYAFENIENGMASVIRPHIRSHAFVIEELKRTIGIQSPKALDARGVTCREGGLFPGLVDSERNIPPFSWHGCIQRSYAHRPWMDHLINRSESEPRVSFHGDSLFVFSHFILLSNRPSDREGDIALSRYGSNGPQQILFNSAQSLSKWRGLEPARLPIMDRQGPGASEPLPSLTQGDTMHFVIREGIEIGTGEDDIVLPQEVHVAGDEICQEYGPRCREDRHPVPRLYGFFKMLNQLGDQGMAGDRADQRVVYARRVAEDSPDEK